MPKYRHRQAEEGLVTQYDFKGACCELYPFDGLLAAYTLVCPALQDKKHYSTAVRTPYNYCEGI